MEEIRKTVEMEQLVGEDRTQTLVHAETIVPGAGKEPVLILFEDARAALGTIDVQADRVVADGMVQAQALYKLGAQGEAQALTASAPISRAIEMPGAQPGMACACSAVVEHVEAKYENGHIVFLITVGLTTRVTQMTQQEILCDISGEEGIEKSVKTLPCAKMAAESTAQAILQGDARMPAVLDARTALMDWCSVRIDSVSEDLGGVQVSGAVLAEALVGSGVPGRPVALVKYALPFAQLVDLPDWLRKDAQAGAQISSLNTKLQQMEDGSTALHFEAELDIRVQANLQEEIAVLCDAYGTGASDIACEYGEISICTALESSVFRENLRANMELNDAAPSVGTVIAVRARPQIAEISPTDSGARVSGLMEAQALYLASGSGEMCVARGDVAFSLDCPFAISENDDIRIEIESADATALLAQRLELSFAVQATAKIRRESAQKAVLSASAVPAKKPEFGVTLYWPAPEESLWEIGKKYRVSGARIDEINPGRKPDMPLIVRG